MLDQAAAVGTARPVRMAAGRRDGSCRSPTRSFDAVVCQFGVMFFPDKAESATPRRGACSRRAASFLFNVWDRIEDNEFADTVTPALAVGLPRRPAALHGAHAARLPRPARRIVARPEAAAASRAAPRIETVAARSRAPSARVAGDGVLPGHAAAQRDRGARCRRSLDARHRRRRARRSRRASAAAPSTARSRRTSSCVDNHDDEALPMSRIAGIDVGGTFTDLIVVDDDERRGAHRQGADDGRQPGLRRARRARRAPASIRPRSTPSSTARRRRPTRCSSARSPRVGLITTRGFRDVLELGRRTRPTPYGLKGRFVPLIERHLRLEVDERMDAEGRVLVPLDEAGVAAAARAADRARRRERRRPLPAQLPQPGARGARRRDRARASGRTAT